MNIAIVAPNTNVKSWEKQFNLNSSSVNISIWPNIDNYDDIDMFTTVVVGNASSYVYAEKFITPRGYEKKIGVSDATK